MTYNTKTFGRSGIDTADLTGLEARVMLATMLAHDCADVPGVRGPKSVTEVAYYYRHHFDRNGLVRGSDIWSALQSLTDRGMVECTGLGATTEESMLYAPTMWPVP